MAWINCAVLLASLLSVPTGDFTLSAKWQEGNPVWKLSPIIHQVIRSSWNGRPFGHNRHVPKIGVCAPFLVGAGSPSNTMWPGPRPTFVPSGILIHPPVWPQQTWAENWGAVPLWRRGSWVPIWSNVARAAAYLHDKFHLDPSNHLATIHHRYRDRQTGQTDNGPIAQGEPFYKRSPRKVLVGPNWSKPRHITSSNHIRPVTHATHYTLST